MLLDQPEAQRLALFFDSLVVPQGHAVDATPFPPEAQDLAEFLADQQVLQRVWRLPDGVPFPEREEDLAALTTGELRVGVLGLAPRGELYPGEPIEDRVLRRLALNVLVDGEHPLPLLSATPSPPPEAPIRGIELVVRDVELPPENTPWQDVLEFRNDAATTKARNRFRLWFKRAAEGSTPVPNLLEEVHEAKAEWNRGVRASSKLSRLSQLALTLEVSSLVAGIVIPVPEVVNLLSLSGKLATARAAYIAVKAGEPGVGREVAFLSLIDRWNADNARLRGATQ